MNIYDLEDFDCLNIHFLSKQPFYAQVFKQEMFFGFMRVEGLFDSMERKDPFLVSLGLVERVNKYIPDLPKGQIAYGKLRLVGRDDFQTLESLEDIGKELGEVVSDLLYSRAFRLTGTPTPCEVVSDRSRFGYDFSSELSELLGISKDEFEDVRNRIFPELHQELYAWVDLQSTLLNTSLGEVRGIGVYNTCIGVMRLEGLLSSVISATDCRIKIDNFYRVKERVRVEAKNL